MLTLSQYLICNMTTFRKKKFLPFDPTPGFKGVRTEYNACMVFYNPFPLVGYAT